MPSDRPHEAPPRPTEAELEILRVLWTHGPATVRDVLEKLPAGPAGRARGYTTVLKMLQIMSAKGLVERSERQRAHVYRSRLTEQQTQRQLTADLLERAFDGSASRLVMQALSSRPASQEELAEIRRLLDELEG